MQSSNRVAFTVDLRSAIENVIAPVGPAAAVDARRMSYGDEPSWSDFPPFRHMQSGACSLDDLPTVINCGQNCSTQRDNSHTLWVPPLAPISSQ